MRVPAKGQAAATASAFPTCDVVGTAVQRGALLSAIGSLPQHLMSVLIALAIADGVLGVERAGWIGAAYIVGMLITTIGLPLFGVASVSRRAAATALLAMSAGAAVAMFLQEPSIWLMVASWGAIGAACGTLSLLGSLIAAAQADGRPFLQVRLGSVLLGSAMVLGLAHSLGLLTAFSDALRVLVVVPLLGLVLLRDYRPATCKPGSGDGMYASPTACTAAVPSLLLLALFFVGQSGFTAFAAYIANTNGLPAAGLPLVYASVKAGAACVLFAAARRTARAGPTLLLSLVLALSVLGMLWSGSSPIFLASLLAWEVAINLQSTRFQAEILRCNPAIGGRWLMACIASGAAAGPVIHGVMLEHKLGLIFAMLSVTSAFVPAMWARRRRKTEHSS